MTIFLSDPIPSVRLPVRIGPDGSVRFFGGELPAIDADTPAELIVPEYAVRDPYQLMLLRSTITRLLVPAGGQLFVEIGGQSLPVLPPGLRKHVLSPDPRTFSLTGQRHFVPVSLREDLRVRLSVGKPVELEPCPCHIPALGRDADSLNEAYTLISEQYEPYRRSHTGNVYLKAYLFSVEGGLLRAVRLDELRNNMQAELEEHLRFMRQPWWIQGAGSGWGPFWAWVAPAPEGGGVEVHVVQQAEHGPVEVEVEPFSGEAAALQWLHDEGFDLLDTAAAPERHWPPVPPYRPPAGQGQLTLGLRP